MKSLGENLEKPFFQKGFLKVFMIMQLKSYLFFLLVAVGVFFSSMAVAKPPKQNLTPNRGKSYRSQFAPDEIIVKFKYDAYEKISNSFVRKNITVTGVTSLDKLNNKYGVVKMKQALPKAGKAKRKLNPKAKNLLRGLRRIYKVKLKQGSNVLQAVSEYGKDPNVEYAEPNYIYSINSVTPNDPYFNDQWGLHNTGQEGGTANADINAPEAWDINTGSDDIVVAVIDTGVDYTHPDLAQPTCGPTRLN